jgi:hypothetical protein
MKRSTCTTGWKADADLSTWLSNIVSVALLAAVWAVVFRRRTLALPVNLLYFAALCLPFAEVLTVSAGMRLIATDWIALVLIVALSFVPPSRRLAADQRLGIALTACLGLLPLLALTFFRPVQLSLPSDPYPAWALRLLASGSAESYAIYGVESLRWMQQCALLIAVVAMVHTQDRSESLIDWTKVG